jgi:hypothetical protein
MDLYMMVETSLKVSTPTFSSKVDGTRLKYSRQLHHA